MGPLERWLISCLTSCGTESYLRVHPAMALNSYRRWSIHSRPLLQDSTFPDREPPLPFVVPTIRRAGQEVAWWNTSDDSGTFPSPPTPHVLSLLPRLPCFPGAVSASLNTPVSPCPWFHAQQETAPLLQSMEGLCEEQNSPGRWLFFRA